MTVSCKFCSRSLRGRIGLSSLGGGDVDGLRPSTKPNAVFHPLTDRHGMDFAPLESRFLKVDLAAVFAENEAVTLLLHKSRDASTDSSHVNDVFDFPR